MSTSAWWASVHTGVFAVGCILVLFLPIPQADLNNCHLEDPVTCEEPQAAPAAKQDLTKPQWVVLFRVDQTANKQAALNDTMLELRLLIRADTEGDATVKALLHAQRYLINTDWDLLRFIEVQRKSDGAGGEPKK